jgi:hypothetical protein
MAEPEDKPPVTGEDGVSGDDYFVNAPQLAEGDDVPQLEPKDPDIIEDDDEQVEVEATELEQYPSPADPQALQVMQELKVDGSELSSIDASSVDALPRRADSPIDSVLSGPDDAPSVQVRGNCLYSI